ncbi:MAG TPA: MaoC family dehydratase N-terminal domain-containing protein [Caulobacterales bacterium]|nr:MaoC family dehydratase N-terminal domain-containing protein [Caulobacterales bacterium]
MIDRKLIGKKMPSRGVQVERGQARLFCKAIGETNPIYIDESAARAAGYEGLPTPPTFAFALNMLAEPANANFFAELGVNYARVLHGEQGFEYHAPIMVGDSITFDGEIADIYDKKNGALEFVVTKTTGRNQRGVKVVTLTSVAAVRN